jgi:hypothetical protein
MLYFRTVQVIEPETNGRLNIPKDDPKKNNLQEILKQAKNSQPILEDIEVDDETHSSR